MNAEFNLVFYRLMKKTVASDTIPEGLKTKCLLWQGHKADGGHGRISYKDRIVLTHRLAFCTANELNYDDQSFQCNHKCSKPNCWNIDHIYKGNQLDNMRDRTASGMNPQSNKLYCKQGHEYTPENTGIRKINGKFMQRYCRTCVRASDKRRRQDKRLGC